MGEPADAPAVSFAKADFDKPQHTTFVCGFCKMPLTDQYWQVARRTACASCRSSVERQLIASTSREAFWGALRYGGLAAIASSIGWIVITKVTGYEIGIVAIGIGFFVGKSVRKGAGDLGGRRYQYLALFLTYSAIALASLPAIFDAVAHSGHQASQAPAHVGVGSFLLAWLTLLLFAYASPFLDGVRSVMGLFIIAIGLWEAWKLTRAVPIEVLGPFSVEALPPT